MVEEGVEGGGWRRDKKQPPTKKRYWLNRLNC